MLMVLFHRFRADEARCSVSAVPVTCEASACKLVMTVCRQHSVLVASALSVFLKEGAASAPFTADGNSLVHRAAGNSFWEHVPSKGNNIDVWEGFLSFGELFTM